MRTDAQQSSESDLLRALITRPGLRKLNDDLEPIISRCNEVFNTRTGQSVEESPSVIDLLKSCFDDDNPHQTQNGEFSNEIFNKVCILFFYCTQSTFVAEKFNEYFLKSGPFPANCDPNVCWKILETYQATFWVCKKPPTAASSLLVLELVHRLLLLKSCIRSPGNALTLVILLSRNNSTPANRYSDPLPTVPVNIKILLHLLGWIHLDNLNEDRFWVEDPYERAAVAKACDLDIPANFYDIEEFPVTFFTWLAMDSRSLPRESEHTHHKALVRTIASEVRNLEKQVHSEFRQIQWDTFYNEYEQWMLKNAVSEDYTDDVANDVAIDVLVHHQTCCHLQGNIKMACEILVQLSAKGYQFGDDHYEMIMLLRNAISNPKLGIEPIAIRAVANIVISSGWPNSIERQDSEQLLNEAFCAYQADKVRVGAPAFALFRNAAYAIPDAQDFLWDLVSNGISLADDLALVREPAKIEILYFLANMGERVYFAEASEYDTLCSVICAILDATRISSETDVDLVHAALQALYSMVENDKFKAKQLSQVLLQATWAARDYTSVEGAESLLKLALSLALLTVHEYPPHEIKASGDSYLLDVWADIAPRFDRKTIDIRAPFRSLMRFINE